jgi:cell division septation protein DedD
MEKQKIVWIILSVSIFVVVILVTGVLLLKQKPAPAALTQTISPLADPGTRIYEYGQDKPQAGTQGDRPTAGDTMDVTIGDGENGQAAAPEKPAVPSAPEKTRPLAVQPAPGPVKAPHVKPPAPRTVKTAEYWIQTGSYRSQSRAEDLAKLLTDKGLAGRVSSFTSRKDSFFRVRIGPYTNRAEAEKFLTIVKQIQGLETSYISSVAGTRTVN